MIKKIVFLLTVFFVFSSCENERNFFENKKGIVIYKSEGGGYYMNKMYLPKRYVLEFKNQDTIYRYNYSSKTEWESVNEGDSVYIKNNKVWKK